MLRTTFALLALIALVAAPAWSAGTNLAWQDCGLDGLENLSPTCTEETGTFTIVGSVVPPAGLGSVVGFDATLDLQVEGQSLPPWWQMGEGCRSGRMLASFDFTSGPFGCEDFWRGQAVGGIAYYEGTPTRNRVLIRLIAAVVLDNARPMSAGVEYSLFKLIIQKSGTIGCEGCTTPACIQIRQVRISQPAPLNHAIVVDRAFRNAVSWQGGISSPDPELPMCRVGAVRNPTWGQMKNLYR